MLTSREGDATLSDFLRRHQIESRIARSLEAMLERARRRAAAAQRRALHRMQHYTRLTKAYQIYRERPQRQSSI